MRYLTTLLFTLFIPVVLSSQEINVRSVLENFIGEWRGQFKVTTKDGRLIKTLEVQQSYWWEGNEQKGVAVFQEGERITYAQSSITFDGGELISVVRYGNDEPEKFFGRIVSPTAISWLPLNLLDARYKQHREMVLEKDGRTLLISQGIDRITVQEQPVEITILGELEKVMPSTGNDS